MKPYYKNPRQITSKQYHDLEKWLRELGDLSGIVHDLNSDEIIGGNQRSRIFNINDCQVELTEGPHEPDEQGTVAVGFILWEGKRYAYRQVRWGEKQCEQANIVANKAGGSWDFDILANEWNVPDLIEFGFNVDVLRDLKREVAALDTILKSEEGEIDNSYSCNIEAPIYTPKGDKPGISDLFDDTRARELITEIDAADLPDEEKEFLRIAARRHTVLNYKRIADYYAHSSEGIQKLMEDSALVIIDFNRAIELGYVKLSEEIAKLYGEDYSDA